MRTAFIQTLCEAAEKDNRTWLLSGDLGYSVLELFAIRFPDRFINAGIAEQNMIGVAAGLALCGKIVFVYSIANFPLMRCLEQIRNDICYQSLNVKIVAIGGGLGYGTAGYTHHAVEDLAVMRSMPNLTIIAPGDPLETRWAAKAMAVHPGPVYLRLPKAGNHGMYAPNQRFSIGKAIVVRQGKDLTLISTGGMLEVASEAARQLALAGIDVRLLQMTTIKPVDCDAILAAASETGAIVTIEDHSVIGGLGSAVAEVLAEHGAPIPFRRLGLSEELSLEHGSQDYLLQKAGLSVPALIDVANQMVAVS